MAFFHSHMPTAPSALKPAPATANTGFSALFHSHDATAAMPSNAGLIALRHSHIAAWPTTVAAVTIPLKTGLRTLFHAHRAAV
jgi:hypothetical protein